MDGELVGRRAAQRAAGRNQNRKPKLQGAMERCYHCIGDVLRSDELSCQRRRFPGALRRQAGGRTACVRAAQRAAKVRGNAERASAAPLGASPASLVASMAAVAVVAGVAMQRWVTDVGSTVHLPRPVAPAPVPATLAGSEPGSAAPAGRGGGQPAERLSGGASASTRPAWQCRVWPRSRCVLLRMTVTSRAGGATAPFSCAGSFAVACIRRHVLAADNSRRRCNG